MERSMTDEQTVMQNTARLFAVKSISPSAGEYDSLEAPYPQVWMEKAAELGFMSMIAPVEFGGVGAGLTDAGIIIEEVAAGCGGMAAAMAASLTGIFAAIITKPPKKALENILSEILSSNASKFRASAAGVFQTAFIVNPDGTISGEETAVLGFDKCTWTATIAREGNSASLWIVAPAMDGAECIPMKGSLGLRTAAPGKMKLKNVEGDRFGEIDPEVLLAFASLLSARAAIGCARAALEDARKYATYRYQGCTMIIEHDAVAHMILNNRAKIEAAKSRIEELMRKFDAAVNFETGDVDKNKIDITGAILARIFAMDAALSATIDAVQCFGGYGYMHDFPVEKRLRDARALGVIFGTNPELMTHLKSTLKEE